MKATKKQAEAPLSTAALINNNLVKLLICIPTYNEAENIIPFLNAVFENIPAETDVLVVDDNSPDGTAELVEKFADAYPARLYLLHRPEKAGLAGAYLAAFAWGLERNYDAFLEMDADFSHNPKYIPQMLGEIHSHGVVIGSRNVEGGGVEGWGLLRNIVSKGGSLYSRAVLGCPVKDLTGGFNMWRKETLLKIGLNTIISKGYSFQVEMKYRAWRAGCSIKELPIIFTDRKYGASKMSRKIFFEALLNVWKIRAASVPDNGVAQFLKFCVTGILGTITNLLIFFLLADKLTLPEIPVSIGCFLIAGTQNYIINHKWSFTRTTRDTALSMQRWLAFLSASLAGLAVNIAVMKFIIFNFTLPYKFIAQAFGIAAGMAVNFTASKLFVFKSNGGKKND